MLIFVGIIAMSNIKLLLNKNITVVIFPPSTGGLWDHVGVWIVIFSCVVDTFTSIIVISSCVFNVVTLRIP